MKRRSILTALSGLPFLGFLRAESEVKPCTPEPTEFDVKVETEYQWEPHPHPRDRHGTLLENDQTVIVGRDHHVYGRVASWDLRRVGVASFGLPENRIKVQPESLTIIKTANEWKQGDVLMKTFANEEYWWSKPNHRQDTCRCGLLKWKTWTYCGWCLNTLPRETIEASERH